jgi:ferredoxin--NADP+ reductase
MNPIMVDGTGMCGCCRLNVDGSIKFGCVDGPEFDGLKVDWDDFMNRMRHYKEEEKISMEKYETEVGDLSWL